MSEFGFFNPLGQLGYGSATNEEGPLASVPVEARGGGGNMLQRIQRKPFVTNQRRRLNVVPLLICFFLPYGLFVFDFWISSSDVRYNLPAAYDLAIVVSCLLVLACVIVAVSVRFRIFSKEDHRDPSWLTFLALSMILSLAVAYSEGDNNFTNLRKYRDYNNLNDYTDIYPDRMRGQQLLDAGVVRFARGTRLDISLSDGFKDGTVYCVAPIVHGNASIATYDFWAVGKDCCSGSQSDFHCRGSRSEGLGGLRLMDSGARAKYRLAVQQAEANYGIKAVHPLFFEWTPDPEGKVQHWHHTATRNFLVWIFAAMVFQIFLVVTAALFFSRLGML